MLILYYLMIIMIKAHYNNDQYTRNYKPLSEHLSINAYGIQEKMPPGMVDRQRGTGDYLFMFFYDSVNILVRETIQRVPRSSIMVWPPWTRHLYGREAGSFIHSWLHCDGSLIRSMVQECQIITGRPILHAHSDHFERFLHALHQEISAYTHPDQRIIENCAKNFFYCISHYGKGEKKEWIIPERILKVRDYIEREFSKKISLELLAKIANLSIPHLCAEFKRYMKVSPIEYCIRFRLSLACGYLTGTSDRIGEIAEAIGIPDGPYFSKVFKRRYGKSPLKYRLQCIAGMQNRRN
jgi:AraC family transcriptional regulator, arabinose operon regulatory protein